MEDTFECAMMVDQRYPDDIEQWPEDQRWAVLTATRRLIEREGLKVLKATATCTYDTVKQRFLLLYTVKLDRAFPVEA